MKLIAETRRVRFFFLSFEFIRQIPVQITLQHIALMFPI